MPKLTEKKPAPAPRKVLSPIQKEMLAHTRHLSRVGCPTTLIIEHMEYSPRAKIARKPEIRVRPNGRTDKAEAHILTKTHTKNMLASRKRENKAEASKRDALRDHAARMIAMAANLSDEDFAG